MRLPTATTSKRRGEKHFLGDFLQNYGTLGKF